MKTRTLLLLSVVTGVVILLAGGIQLLRLSNQDEAVPASQLGHIVRVADMEIVVDGASERGERLRVAVTLGGVDDADGAVGFSLLVPGAGVLRPDDGASAADVQTACGATTVARRSCSVSFDVSDASGDVRTLRYERGEESARWLLPRN